MKNFLDGLTKRIAAEFENATDTYFNGTEQEVIQEEIQKTRELLRTLKNIPPIIGGKEISTSTRAEAKNPSCTTEILGNISYVGEREAGGAIEIIKTSASSKKWRRMSCTERSRVIDTAADIIESKRRFFIALMILEVGKHPEDADKEVSEAVDFLRLYAAQARMKEDIARKSIISPAGEKNTVILGPAEEPAICLSIQPWNFPLAISAGPMAAALVSGYSVLYKPAEESSLVGYFLTKFMHEAGVPKDVLHFLPGKGEVVGAYLVTHKDVKVICFTGSSSVGRMIEREVSKFNLDILPTLPRTERYRKRIATMETGGNNVLIVDSSADRTEWLRGVLRSAFSFAGQKCSALQRVIFVDNRRRFYEVAAGDLKEAIQEILVGSPEDFGVFYGPVISQSAYERIITIRETARKLGAQITQGVLKKNAGEGYFIPPFLIEGLPNDHELVQGELFGPGLFLLRASTIEEAVEMANDTEYGLTGGICSKIPAHIKYVQDNLVVGNGYGNKPIVGARVLCQPFGGLKESGGFGFKAGGISYLDNFLREARVFSENTMRQGVCLLPLDPR
jgi:RHH-type proline utilization regulon transcriptional repressor/proline dehydrogenase/delta 1-pyrroline-5-carboxylate dehydrogenase